MLEVLDPSRNFSQKTIREALKRTATVCSMPDEALLAMLARNPTLSNKTLKEVFRKSVPLSAEVLDVLQNQMNPPLPNGVLNSILRAHYHAIGQCQHNNHNGCVEDDEDGDNNDPRNGEERDILEDIIAYNTQTIFEVNSHLLGIYLEEENDVEVRNILESYDFDNFKKMLVSLEVSEGNYIDARTVLAAINQSGTIEEQNYFDLQTVIIDLEEAGTDLQNMSASQEQTVRDVANSGTLVATEAEVVLTIAFGEEFEHPIMKYQPSGSNKMGTQYGYWGTGEDEKNDIQPNSELETDYFRLFPNPNTGTFTIEFSYKVADNASFHMYDMLGRKVKTISLTGKGNAVTISDANLYNGLYIYELRIDGEIKVSDKVIVHK